jgi:hypothetical protein
MNIFDEIKNDAHGLALLKDWVGDGGHPVSKEKADARAQACIGHGNLRPCPMNKEPNWWQKFTNSIALTIRRQLELKEKASLVVWQEDRLHMCAACGCALPLKVWVPIEHVKSHLSVEQLNKTPSFCWMRKEIENA